MRGLGGLTALIVVAGALLSGCGAGFPVRAAPGIDLVPALEEIANATYSGLNDVDGPITLVAGAWQGEPFVAGGASRPRVTLAPGFRVTGDLDGDGRDEAVVVLAHSAGGSGTFDYLAAVRRSETTVQNIATVALGDRVAIRSAAIDSGVLRVEVLRAGEGDAMCCPGELAELAWTLGKGGFVAAESAGVTGRLSLETLAGREWVLREWQLGETAPVEPQVTLIYRDGQFAGSSGCNRYFVSVTGGETPGDMSAGAVGATRMACPEPAAAIEQRYLQRLGDVGRFGFLLGRLALSYRREDGSVGSMLFEDHGPAVP